MAESQRSLIELLRWENNIMFFGIEELADKSPETLREGCGYLYEY